MIIRPDPPEIVICEKRQMFFLLSTSNRQNLKQARVNLPARCPPDIPSQFREREKRRWLY